ncbi:hypothetical protein ACWAXZ_004888, partial [Escherichia coli]
GEEVIRFGASFCPFIEKSTSLYFLIYLDMVLKAGIPYFTAASLIERELSITSLTTFNLKLSS